MKPYITHLRNIHILRNIHSSQLEQVKEHYRVRKDGHAIRLIKNLIGKPLARDNERLKIDLESNNEIFSFRALMYLLNINNSITVRRNKCKAYINPITRSVYDKRYNDAEIAHIEAFSLDSFTKRLLDSDILRLKKKIEFEETTNDSNGSYKIDFKALWENPEVEQKPKNNNTDGERRKEGRVPNIQRASALVTRGTGREGRKVCCKAREALPTRGHCSY